MTRSRVPAFMTVGQAAERLGVAPSTLRTWERRYGLAPGGRSAGGHRRYRPQDLAVLQTMRDLVLSGEKPARAAERAITTQDLAAPDGPFADGQVVTGAGEPGVDPTPPGVRARTAERLSDTLSGAASAGTFFGSVTDRPPDADPSVPPDADPLDERLSIPNASQPVRRLAVAAVNLDADACVHVIVRALALGGVEITWDQVLRPVLVAAGVYWARTGTGVEVEHLLSNACIEALTAYRRDCPRPEARPPVLLACAPGDQHDLPLHVLAAALAERRVPSRVLGAAVPGPAMVAATQRTGARAVFVWAQIGDPRHGPALAALSTCRPPPRVVLGGPGWDGSPPAPRTTRATSLGDASRALAPDPLARTPTPASRPLL